MENNCKWIYFNIHGLVGIRVETGHASERSVKLMFGPFEVDSLEKIDLTLQYEQPELGEYSFASNSYLFSDHHVYIKKYRLHLLREKGGFILASKRDLLPFVGPVIQWLLLEKQYSLVHSAAVAVDGRGVLLAGWGGTGKTSAIVCLLKEIQNSSFLSDDLAIIGSNGRLLSFPKAFFIYPYHRELFPHVFKSEHKPLVPRFLSGPLGYVRESLRPAILAFPKLENFCRRITPEHMQVPARTCLPDARFDDAVPLEKLLFVERYSGHKCLVDELSLPEAKSKLIGNWSFEQGRLGIELILGAGSTGVLDLESYFSGMSDVLDKALNNLSIYRLRIGGMIPSETGKAIVKAVRDVLSS